MPPTFKQWGAHRFIFVVILEAIGSYRIIYIGFLEGAEYGPMPLR